MLARASSAPRSVERLRERRRSRRRSSRVVFLILLLLLLIGVVYGLRQGAVRISHIQTSGTDSDLTHYATNAMQGMYLWLIPRDSFFFVPEGHIRSAILADYPDLATVSIRHIGLKAVMITVTERTAVARWCGSTRSNLVELCYVFDPNGFIFALAATSTQTLNSFLLYSPLTSTTTEQIRATLANSAQLPATFDFARRISAFGTSVATIEINNGEVNDSLENGTRVTYLLGHEQQAITALVSAGENLNLSDGSLEYVDLRFDGKVYLKKK